MCPRLDSHNSRHNTTKNLWNLNREKSHEKFSFGKRLRRKKNEIKNRKCSYENIWWWLIIIIVILLSTSARCWSRCSGLIQTSFFFGVSQLSSCGIFFGLLCTHFNESGGINLFLNTFCSLAYYNCQFNKKSLSILHTASQCFQFYRFSVLAHWRRWWWWRARESSVTSPTQGSSRWSSISWRTQKYLVKLDNSTHWWESQRGDVCCDILAKKINDMPAIVV